MKPKLKILIVVSVVFFCCFGCVSKYTNDDYDLLKSEVAELKEEYDVIEKDFVEVLAINQELNETLNGLNVTTDEKIFNNDIYEEQVSETSDDDHQDRRLWGTYIVDDKYDELMILYSSGLMIHLYMTTGSLDVYVLEHASYTFDTATDELTLILFENSYIYEISFLDNGLHLSSVSGNSRDNWIWQKVN